MHGSIGATDDEEIGFFNRARTAQHTWRRSIHRDLRPIGGLLIAQGSRSRA